MLLEEVHLYFCDTRDRTRSAKLKLDERTWQFVFFRLKIGSECISISSSNFRKTLTCSLNRSSPLSTASRPQRALSLCYFAWDASDTLLTVHLFLIQNGKTEPTTKPVKGRFLSARFCTHSVIAKRKR